VDIMMGSLELIIKGTIYKSVYLEFTGYQCSCTSLTMDHFRLDSKQRDPHLTCRSLAFARFLVLTLMSYAPFSILLLIKR
jgi:hypothetical protein